MNTVQSAIDEALEESMTIKRFRTFLIECLTAKITYNRGSAPEEVAILNDPEKLNDIVEDYRARIAEAGKAT